MRSFSGSSPDERKTVSTSTRSRGSRVAASTTSYSSLPHVTQPTSSVWAGGCVASAINGFQGGD